MPRPKTPNTSAATKASVASRARAKHERMAAELHTAGWYLVAPERAEDVRVLVSNSSSYEEDWPDAEWKPA